MADHGKAASTVQEGVSGVRKEPVVVNQGRSPIVSNNTRGAGDNSRTVTGTGPTGTGTSGNPNPPSGDTSGSDAGGTPTSNDARTNQTDTPTPQPKPTLDGLAIDDLASLPDDKLEEKYKEMAEQGFDVDEIKNKVETAKTTNNTNTPKGSDGRDKAGQVKGLMDDPDWGKPLDDKFDIQQGDFIDFLMKEVVLASAAWTGNKVCGIGGYALYKGGSSFYHWAWGGIKKGWNKADEALENKKKKEKENQEKINNENLYSGAMKHDNKTSRFAKSILNARKDFLDEVENDPQLKSARVLSTYVRSTIRGEMDIDGAVAGKNGKYTITRKYKDDKGKEQSQKITVDEKTYKTLLGVHQNVQKTIGDHGDSPELRAAMDADITQTFVNAADILYKEKIFAADYAASVLIEKAARMTPEEIEKLKPSKEFQNLVNGEGKLTYYHHLYDMEHRKSAFKGDKEKSPLSQLSDAGHAALGESVKMLNNAQHREATSKLLKDGAFKEVPQNASLERVFINGKSEYAPEVNTMSEAQMEASLRYMQTDATQGFNRLDQLNRQQTAIDREISAIASDAQNADQRKAELEQRKKDKTTEHDKGTEHRDAVRAAAFNNIRGNIK